MAIPAVANSIINGTRASDRSWPLSKTVSLQMMEGFGKDSSQKLMDL
jgi:hypothetical protein